MMKMDIIGTNGELNIEKALRLNCEAHLKLTLKLMRLTILIAAYDFFLKLRLIHFLGSGL